MVNIGPKAVIAAGGVIIVLILFLKRQTIGAVADVAKAVNPVDPENIINRYFATGYKAVTGSTQTLGADVYDWLHPRHPAKEKTEVDIATESEIAQAIPDAGGRWLLTPPRQPVYDPEDPIFFD